MSGAPSHSVKSTRGALARLPQLVLTISRRRCRLERIEETMRRVGDLLNRQIERRLVRPRRLRGPAQLADELERRGVNLLMRRRRIEIGKGPDTATHLQTPDWLRIY